MSNFASNVAVVAGIMTLAWGISAIAEPFMLKSATFNDGAMLPAKSAGANKANPNCVGENVSPELTWSHAPSGTKSFVLVMSDSEGQSGLGSHHLLAYNIAPSVTGFAEGELSNASDKFTGGKETGGTTMYRGPCPPAGSGMHHYVFDVIATDLDPGVLPAGLTREELWDKLKGHAKGAAGLVGLFGRP